jgi:CDP-4-dehydro-6-deoxyglucose reductase
MAQACQKRGAICNFSSTPGAPGRDSVRRGLYKTRMASRWCEVMRADTLSPSVRALELRAVDGEPIGHVAGQWLNLDVPVAPAGPAERVARRAYSIASAPQSDSPDRFEIAVTRVRDGEASTVLHELPVGVRLAFDGPHGFFTREAERDEPALLVGTGTGLCPLRAMLEDELARASGPRVALLFGCRSERDILWREQLEAWAREQPRFSLHVTLSQPSADWGGRSGYVQRHVGELAHELGKPIVYACGLSPMVADVRRVLKDELGYDRKRIRSERYD